MKVAILTLTGDNNYGNKLQNYAVQYQLKKMGCEVTTIRITSEDYLQKIIPILMFTPLASLLGKYKNKFRRKVCFFHFNRFISQDYKNVALGNEDLLKKKLMTYDKVVYGSDQIWNTEMKSFSKMYLGYCAPKEKNIALSASFGTDSIDSMYTGLFQDGLQNFNCISVREEVGSQIVRSVAGRESIVLPDPTLTVPVEEWMRMERQVKTPDKYILTYFLGKEPCETVKKIAEDNMLKIVDASIAQPYGPSEFLYLIHHAALVCTDSFHACVFSILYKKTFCIFNRDDKFTVMSSRIDNLIKTLGIQGKQHKGYYLVEQEVLNTLENSEKIRTATERFIHFLSDVLYES